MDKEKDKYILLDIGWADEEKTTYIIHDVDRFKNWLIKKGLDPDEVLREDHYITKRIAYLIQRYGDMKVTVGPSGYIGNTGLEVRPAVVLGSFTDGFYDELVRRSRYHDDSVTKVIEYIVYNDMPYPLFYDAEFLVLDNGDTRNIYVVSPIRFSGCGVYFSKEQSGEYVLDDDIVNKSVLAKICRVFKCSEEEVIKKLTEEVNNFKEKEVEKDD